MRGQLIGRRRDLAQVYRLLLFEDRLEEVSHTLVSAEVRRLFFDEVECATVHRVHQWMEVGLLGLMAAVLFGVALVNAGSEPGLASVLGIVGGVLATSVAGLLLFPPYVLNVHAPGQSFHARLPRTRGSREEALRRFVRTVETHQSRGET